MRFLLVVCSLVLLGQGIDSAATRLTPTANFAVDGDFKIGQPLTVNCSLGGFQESDAENAYTVSYWFAPKNDIKAYPIASYAIFKPVILFNTTGLQSQVKVEEGSSIFPDFTVKITPENENAHGKYKCGVLLDTATEVVYSNEYSSSSSSFGILPSVLLLAFSVLGAIILRK